MEKVTSVTLPSSSSHSHLSPGEKRGPRRTFGEMEPEIRHRIPVLFRSHSTLAPRGGALSSCRGRSQERLRSDDEQLGLQYGVIGVTDVPGQGVEISGTWFRSHVPLAADLVACVSLAAGYTGDTGANPGIRRSVSFARQSLSFASC